MRLEQLHIENLRNIATLDVALAPGINVFVGPNGAGKSSILEAAYLLSHAQSFRLGTTHDLIRRGEKRLAVAATARCGERARRIALIRDDSSWHGRIDQTVTTNLGAVLGETAVVCFEPGSHELIAGSGRERRRFLDWGVFHVEHAYLATAARYRRSLRQRNMALKNGAADGELDAWDVELASAAAPMDLHRQQYFSRFRDRLAELAGQFLPELGEVNLAWDRGWPSDASLLDLLAQRRSLDRIRGHTSRGPHRADWLLRFEQAPQRGQLSRGQEKLCALACVLAQARVHADASGGWPVIALDDLGSELDLEHQARVLDWLRRDADQVLISGVDIPEPLRAEPDAITLFHVEHGSLRGLL
ncbi:MAG: DNA replication/repair protein RecF [Xanthomonadales bacterium PRO7]|nr:DNA replication/repair protein RecF [Xanthomonadales bacterium PRO7]